MSAQIDQRIFSNNKCIDRPNGKLDGWGSFTQRTAADALLVYLLTVPVHAVSSIFYCQETIGMSLLGIEYWREIRIWRFNQEMYLQMLWEKTNSF